MNLAQILAAIAPFASLLKPGLLSLEAQGQAELKSLIESNVTSPDLKALLEALSGALDAFAQLEINKLG